MTTNQERVIGVLYQRGAYCGECGWIETPECPDCDTVLNDYVRSLDRDGLLAPDLPEATMDGDLPRWALPGENGDHDAAVLLAGEQVLLMVEDGTKRAIVSTRDEARRMAYALLAAAEHDEEQEAAGAD